MVRLSKKVMKAMEKAEKQARKEILKPKKPQKRSPKKVNGERSPSGKWIIDQWGEQGEVYFDGKLYWLTTFEKRKGENGIYDVVPKGLSEEEWEEYKRKPVKTRLPREQKSGTTGTRKRLSSTRQTTSSTKRSKAKRSKKSPTKSGRTATHVKPKKLQ